MKSFLALLVAALAMYTSQAFTGHTPVFGAGTTKIHRQNCASTLVMRARVCDLLGKKPNRQARVVTFSHRRIKKVQAVNLQWKRFFSEDLNRKVRLRLSTKGIKTVNKMGSIDAAAKKFEVDLKKY
jgi:large subunit ribosomal protein L28